jgi:FkbM family methyltransferase
MTITLKGDLWWPTDDTHCRRAVTEEVGPAMSWLKAHNTRWDTVIQAGGNVGVYAIELVKLFNNVHTFEPDPVNARCLWRNILHIDGIDARQAALGDMIGRCKTVEVWPNNCGAHRIVEALEGTPVLTIDSIACEPDVIWLDVEGYELQALKGAERTLLEYKPMVITEEKELGKVYGYDDAAIADYLALFGYKHKSTLANDRMYVHGL